MNKKFSLLLSKLLWFDYTRFISATLIFLLGLLLYNFSVTPNAIWDTTFFLSVFTALVLVIYSAIYIVSCFRMPKSIVRNSPLNRYAIGVSDGMLFPFVIAFFDYSYRLICLCYSVAEVYACSGLENGQRMTEAGRVALYTSVLRDNFWNFESTDVPIYLLAGCVIGSLMFYFKQKKIG